MSVKHRIEEKESRKIKTKVFFAGNQEFNVAWLVKEGEMGERTRERGGGGRERCSEKEREKNFSPKLNKFWIAICLDIGREKVHGEV